jgi:ATP-dependent RNA helicase SUPV3L1/SUV3
LPPEARSQQAKLFNQQGENYSVLVASDAIGMGLNLYDSLHDARWIGALDHQHRCYDIACNRISPSDRVHCRNIRRVIFSSLGKYDGITQRQLTVSEIKQIAGRAGRFSGTYPNGLVSSLYDDDLDTIKHSLNATISQLEVCQLLRPTSHQRCWLCCDT